MILGNSASVVTDAFMGPRLGLAMGTMGLAAGLGFALGPLIGGALIRVSWRWVFLINVPIAWVVLVVSLMFLRDPALTRKKVAKTNAERKAILRRFDWVGFALLTFFLVTFLTALSEQAFATMSNVTIGCLWGMGVLGLIGFIAVELYVDNPILKLSLFKIPTFTLMNITNFLVMISAGQILYAMLFYFQGPYKQDPFKAGVSTLPFGLAMAVAGLASGLLADVIGLKFLSLIGVILCAGGSIGFIWLQATTGFGLICFLLIVVGAGIGLFNSPTNKGIMASVEPAQRGAASSTPVLLLNLSRMISLVILFSGSFSALSTDTLLAIFLQGGGAGIDETTLHTFMNGVYICTWIAIGCWLAALILTFFLKEDFWSTWHNFKNAKSKAKLTSDSDNAVTPVGREESPK
jgi:MFS family permease